MKQTIQCIRLAGKLYVASYLSVLSLHIRRVLFYYFLLFIIMLVLTSLTNAASEELESSIQGYTSPETIELPMTESKNVNEICQIILNSPHGRRPIAEEVDTLISSEGPELQDVYPALALRKKESLDCLLAKLDTGTPYEKRKVTKFLGKVRWNEAVPELLKIATSDEEHQLSRISALYTLGSIGNRSVGHTLAPLLEKENRVLTEKRIIIATLAKVKYRPAIPFIEPFINTENPLVCIYAVRALAELGKYSDPGVLLTFLESDNYVVRQEACRALGLIGGSDIIGELKDIAENDWHESVREAAKITLYEIEARALQPAQQYIYYEQASLSPDDEISNWAIQKLAYECGENGKGLLRKQMSQGVSQGKKIAIYLILSNESYNPQ